MTTKNKGYFSGNFIKCIAAFCMVCDHVGVLIFPMELYPEWAFLRYIGRIAFPLFAFFIAEGCTYTKNKARYLAQMAVFGIIFNVVYAFFTGDKNYVNIFVSFALAICMITLLDYIKKEKKFKRLLFLLFFVAFFYVTYRVFQIIHIDYGFYGILLPVMTYCGKTRFTKYFFFTLGIFLVAFEMMSVFTIQICSLLALVPLFFYNGKRGEKNMKYFFYIFYPAHLVIIFIIALLLGKM